MTSHEILKADLLDILFNNRNKLYGAYTLRKYYNNRLSASLLITLGFVCVAVLLIRPGDQKKILLQDKDGVIISQVQLPRENIKIPEVPRQRIPSARAQVATEQYTRIRLVENTQRVMTDVRTLDRAAIGTETRAGVHLTTLQPPELPVLPVSGNGTAVVTVTPSEKPVQREPEFPGGMAAWIRFLQRNLNVPSELQAGEQKTVLMRFLVSIDGTVTGFEVVQSAGRSYDEEVIRALKRMPKWKPAIQNGIPVSRPFTQPVTFVGTE